MKQEQSGLILAAPNSRRGFLGTTSKATLSVTAVLMLAGNEALAQGANANPAAEAVKVTPSAVAPAKSNMASAGKIHADRGIGPCTLMWSHPQGRKIKYAPISGGRQPREAAMNFRTVSIAP